MKYSFKMNYIEQEIEIITHGKNYDLLLEYYNRAITK